MVKTNVSIIMPVHNGEKYIHQSIDSILNQTLKTFELLIIDDNSIDKSMEIAKSFIDKRIRIIKTSGKGISQALNKGLAIAKSPFIARMDCDDICEPDRLQKQVEFMIKTPDKDIIGSQVTVVDSDGYYVKTREVNLTDLDIRISLFLGETSISHPTMMMRTNFLNEHKLQYNSKCDLAEDYDLLCRASFLTKFENMNQSLLKYRIHNNSVSQMHFNKQRHIARRILRNHLYKMGVPFSEEELLCHFQFALPLNEKIKLQDLLNWSEKLIIMNQKNGWFENKTFSNHITQRIERWIKNNENG